MSTKLKLLGVDVASFGDAMGRSPDCLEVVVNDAVNQTYAKLVLSDDAKTLLGGILVGDASSYGVLRPMVGEPLPGDPLALISPAGSDGGAAIRCRRAAGRRADLLVQQRHQGRSVRRDRGAAAAMSPNSRSARWPAPPAARACRCSSSCLRPRASNSPRRCANTSASRAPSCSRSSPLSLLSRSARSLGLIERFGTGKGCDICKPAVASILASTSSEHILDGEQASLQDSNDHFLANIQKNGSYSIVPRAPGGDITPEQLILIGEIARDFNLYTEDHRRAAHRHVRRAGGSAAGDLAPAGRRRHGIRPRLRQGAAHGEELRRQRLVPLRPTGFGRRWPSTSSCATAACARRTRSRWLCRAARANAPRPSGKDVGVIATENGWNLYVCGNGGMTPQARAVAGKRSRRRDAGALHRPVPDVLHPHRRPAAAHRPVGSEALDGGLDHLRDVVCNDSLGSGRRVRGGDCPPRRGLCVRVEGRARGSRASCRGSSPSSTPPTSPIPLSSSPNSRAAMFPSACRKHGSSPNMTLAQ